MHESISLKMPSDLKFMKIVEDLIWDTCETLPLTNEDTQALVESTRELIENAVFHAYKDSQGYIQIGLYLFRTGLRIDVHDWGFPMSFEKHVSVPIKEAASEDFNRVYDLMDLFECQNLGKDGKKFVIIKYASHPLHEEEIQKVLPLPDETTEQEKETDNIPVTVREFKEGDEEGIARQEILLHRSPERRSDHRPFRPCSGTGIDHRRDRCHGGGSGVPGQRHHEPDA